MRVALISIPRAAESAFLQNRIFHSADIFVGGWVGYNSGSEEGEEQECRGGDLGELHFDLLGFQV